MRVVVTGAAGFIGGRLCRALLDAGHQVVGIDRRPRDSVHRAVAWDRLGREDGFLPLPADLLDLDLAEVLRPGDAVVHLAGRPGTHESWSDFAGYLRDNVEVTGRLADAALTAGVGRFVMISSSSIYGLLAGGGEDALPRPASPYGVSKLAAEHTARSYHDAHGLDLVVLRPFSVYGAGQRPDMGIYRAIDAMLHGELFPLFGSGEQTRTLTHVSDLCAAIMSALVRGRPGHSYDIGGADLLSMNQVLAELERLLSVTPRVKTLSDPRGNQRHTRTDSAKAARDLGYRPAMTISQGLAEQIAWQRELCGQ